MPLEEKTIVDMREEIAYDRLVRGRRMRCVFTTIP
jgi:hypothetical protein